MSLEIDAEFSVQLGKKMDGIESRLKRLNRFKFFQRRITGVTTATAAGTITTDLGSPNPGCLWSLSYVFNGPNTTTPWVAIDETKWSGGALCIGNATTGITNTDIIITFGTSTNTKGADNPDFTGFPADSIWVYDTESVYVSHQFTAAASVLNTLIVREYQMDDVLPSYI